MQKNTKRILSIAFILLISAIIVLLLSLQNKSQVITEMAVQYELEKEELADEYSQLSLQYEGYGLRIGNDSLANLLDAERFKVQRLLDELKVTKATNAKRINEMRRELETLRGIMRHYVAQIDSLHAENNQLRAENKVVTQRFQQAQEHVESLSEEKKALTEKVTLASILEARDIQIELLTSKGRKASRISRLAQMRFTFTISKNISAPRGEKHVYIRIIQPDETPLVKNNDNVFLFEDQYINYSARRPIEYTGEDAVVALYWDVEEFLHPGSYRLDIFAYGYQIGTSDFSIKD
ncbi:MAG: hypothetical protein PHI57_00180 [Bacteroidales bacterium]|nr:hypothetical protein [Bacteroidales bacterium]